MKAYFNNVQKEVPQQLQEVFLDPKDTAVITIDMHDGHLSEDPECPCPSPPWPRDCGAPQQLYG